MRKLLALGLLICAAAAAQQVPLSTDLPSHPFFITATWYIGGAGNWDYLTFDRDAGRLYIAHGTLMQVVDVESGSVVGEIRDLYEARQVALDDTGEYGLRERQRAGQSGGLRPPNPQARGRYRHRRKSPLDSVRSA